MLRAFASLCVLACAAALSQTKVRFTGAPVGDVTVTAPSGANLLDVADSAGVGESIARSCLVGTCRVCEVALTRGGKERVVRACTALLRGSDDEEIVVDVRRRDEELARSMARFADGWDAAPRETAAAAAVEPEPSSDWRDAYDASPPPDDWQNPPAVDDGFDLGGSAPWDIIQ